MISGNRWRWWWRDVWDGTVRGSARKQSGLDAHLILLHVISYTILIAGERNKFVEGMEGSVGSNLFVNTVLGLSLCAKQINTASGERPLNSHTLSSP